MKRARPVKGNFSVYVTATVHKRIDVAGCTEEQARKDPYEYAVDEVEIEQMDWSVTRVVQEA